MNVLNIKKIRLLSFYLFVCLWRLILRDSRGNGSANCCEMFFSLLHILWRITDRIIFLATIPSPWGCIFTISFFCSWSFLIPDRFFCLHHAPVRQLDANTVTEFQHTKSFTVCHPSYSSDMLLYEMTECDLNM